jgi:GNAT superfamily N-acetyltransferase
MIEVTKINLPVAGIERLQQESVTEGYDFIETLTEDWASGANRFDGLGEMLCGCFDEGELVGVGGLNFDPFAGDPQIGRVRRVYIRSAWRCKGIGTALLTTLIEEGRLHFRRLRLRAENPAAARLYERLGFVPIEHRDATHILVF